MSAEEKKLNYAVLRTKLAAVRTLLLFIVSIKAFILLSATKHIGIGVIAAVILVLICGYHYYYIIITSTTTESTITTPSMSRLLS